MLNPETEALIRLHPAGMVATINDDGTPSVSPKATFVVVDNTTLAFGNIRSPGTLSNLRHRPAIEICFIDVVLRVAVRVTGTGIVHTKRDAAPSLRNLFDAYWGLTNERISHYVQVDVTACEEILSPAYDAGETQDTLREANMLKLHVLYDR